MNNKEVNEKMALEIKELLVKMGLWHGTSIYFNDKRLNAGTGEPEVEENIKVEDLLEYCNPETVTINYKGDNSLHPYINFLTWGVQADGKANQIINDMTELGNRYNRYYEIGDDCTLYFIKRGTPDTEM